ncbi:roadblock/LC7 domain-containing protein [Micromonospora maris]|nr:roadblock/LC7 domain-containing protein [Micromonospora maris]AEB46588.1 roadblock/lc7 family protein [Micromonospora maris AB-18-032]
MSDRDTMLPRRTAAPPAGPPPTKLPPSLAGNPSLPYPAIGTELTELRLQIPGVRGSVLGGVDGLRIAHDLPAPLNPDDLAAMAATAFGLGRQASHRLGQGDFRQSTVRNDGGYFAVYAVGAHALLSVVGTDTINVARLHLHAPPVADRLATLLAPAVGTR